ncbi:MAG: matrixin family metalloprotease [Candidatus Eremiobacteraeota bacterium]|nr:matrixin family metalloprotease [Candidatus Eremiobacteraeota bacterium]
MKWFASFALGLTLVLPAGAQTGGGAVNFLDLMQTTMQRAGVPTSGWMDTLRNIPELQQLTFPAGYSIPDLPLIPGQLNLPTGVNSYHPSPLPGALPVEIKTSDLPGQPVENYGCMSSGGYPCRFPSDMLPLRVYSPLPERRAIVEKSLAVWNATGQKALKTKLFRQVSEPDQAQIKIDWMGVNVPEGAGGVTTFRVYSNRVQVGEIGILDKPQFSEADLGAFLSHELGHALGLDHSNQPADLMYTAHTVNSSHGDILTQRDAWMLGWLYSQKSAIPLVL